MTIASTASFTVTRNDLVTGALSMLGIVEPQNTDTALGIKVLNSLIRNLDAKGTWLWAISNTQSTLTTIASQSTYTTGVAATNISANILKLEYAAVRIGTDDEPLVILDKYSALKTHLKTDTASQPLACYLERANQTSDNKLIIYPTPNSAYSIKYNFRRPLFDFSAADENPDFPAEWFLPLKKILAYELSYDYSKPLAERQLLQAESKLAYDEVERFNTDKPSYQPLKTEYF